MDATLPARAHRNPAPGPVSLDTFIPEDAVPDIANHASLSSRLILRFTGFYSRSFVHRWKHRNGCPCIFLPTCKEYLERAVVKYGAGRGLLLTVKRLRRCNGRYRGYYLDFP